MDSNPPPTRCLDGAWRRRELSARFSPPMASLYSFFLKFAL